MTDQAPASASGLTGWRELYRRSRTGGIRAVRKVPGVRRAARAIAGQPKRRTVARVRPPRPPRHVEDPTAPTKDVTGHPAGVVTRAGRFFPPGRGQTLPLVLVVVLDVDADALTTLCRRLEQAQFHGAAFRPLIVTAAPVLEVPRRFDYPVEHLMSRAGYATLNPHHRYESYVEDRIRSITAAYRARAVVPLGPDAGAALTDTELRLLGAYS